MFLGQLTVTNGPKSYRYTNKTAQAVKTSADRQMRKLGGTLVQEVYYHPGSFVYTDGTEAIALLVVSEED
jgi:hypothetical protein